MSCLYFPIKLFPEIQRFIIRQYGPITRYAIDSNGNNDILPSIASVFINLHYLVPDGPHASLISPFIGVENDF